MCETSTNTAAGLAGLRAEAAAAKSRGMCYKLKLFKVQNGPINEHFSLMYRRLASEANMNARRNISILLSILKRPAWVGCLPKSLSMMVKQDFIHPLVNRIS